MIFVQDRNGPGKASEFVVFVQHDRCWDVVEVKFAWKDVAMPDETLKPKAY